MDKSTSKLLKEYNLPFSGLKDGEHDYHFVIGDTFFKAFEIGEIDAGNFEVGVILDKREHMLQLYIEADGSITVPCDRCGEPIQLEISGNREQIIKFGDGDYEETDEIDVIPQNAWQINIASYIYELIVLHTPIKRAHDEGQCDPEILGKLNDFQPQDEEKEEEIDPRWAALKNLKNKLD